MAKYIVTSGSHFTPFTYDELVKPVAHMQAAHDAAQDAYDQLNLETNALAQYISQNEDDQRARAMYDSYMNKLKTLQDNLWERGYTAQTRRDLSAARAGYASDITRLAKAVQTRQERSKEYWDARRKNPDLVAGADPGMSGLDRYLENDNYGRDYYSYSGNQFMAEVGADAAARVSEMMQYPDVIADPRLEGYLTVRRRKGFTSADVDNATNAVRLAIRGDKSLLDSLDDNSYAVADILLSHLSSSGALQNLSPEEMDRLINFGVDGLLSTVVGMDEKEVADKGFSASGRSSRGGSGGNGNRGGGTNSTNPTDQLPPQGYYVMGNASDYQSATSAKDAVAAHQMYNLEHSSKRNVVSPSGQSDTIQNPSDALRILNSLGRQNFIDTYGIAPEEVENGATVKVKDENGRVHTGKIRTRRLDDRTGVGPGAAKIGYEIKFDSGYSSAGTRSSDLNTSFIEDLDSYQGRVKEYNNANSMLDLEREARLTGKTSYDSLYEKYNIPEGIRREDVPAYLGTRANIGRYSAASLVNNSSDMDKMLEQYANKMFDSYIKGPRTGRKQDKIHPQSSFGLYKVDPNNRFDYSKEAEETIRTSFKDLSSIDVMPEDVINGKVRITLSDGEYIINQAMLDSVTQDRLSALQHKLIDENGKALTDEGLVEYLMLPLLNPEKSLTMDEKERNDWKKRVNDILGMYGYTFDTPDEITRAWNPNTGQENKQANLRAAVTLLMEDVLAGARDYINLYKFTPRGNSEKFLRPYR